MRSSGIAPFDVHAHTGRDIDGTVRSCGDHVHELRRIGGRSVIFPLCVEGGYEPENARVLIEADRYPETLAPFARLDPRHCDRVRAAAALSAGARGFKLHPRAECFRLEHAGVDDIFAVASEAEVPIVIHAGVGVGSFGAILLELACRHRGCRLILAHAGISDLAWLAPHVPDHPNLFFDTAWLVPNDVRALFASVPPDRILFGSDAPYMDMELVLAVTVRLARSAGLTTEHLASILGGQLEALLAGAPPLRIEPVEEPMHHRPASRDRTLSLLAAAAGCVFGGGDPTRMLELTELSLQPDDSLIGALVAEVRDGLARGSPAAMQGLIMASTLALTPEVDRELAIA